MINVEIREGEDRKAYVYRDFRIETIENMLVYICTLITCSFLDVLKVYGKSGETVTISDMLEYIDDKNIQKTVGEIRKLGIDKICIRGDFEKVPAIISFELDAHEMVVEWNKTDRLEISYLEFRLDSLFSVFDTPHD